MAKQKSERLCDSCGSDDDVRAVRIVITGEPGMTASLCAFCRRPLRRVIDTVRAARKPRVFIRDLPVLSTEEVEKMAAKKRPAVRPSKRH